LHGRWLYGRWLHGRWCCGRWLHGRWCYGRWLYWRWLHGRWLYGRWLHGRRGLCIFRGRRRDCLWSVRGSAWCDIRRAGSVTDGHEGCADFDGLILGYQDGLDHACYRRGDLGVDLIGGDFEQRLVHFDTVAHVFQPAGHRTLGDTLSECREVDGFAHQ